MRSGRSGKVTRALVGGGWPVGAPGGSRARSGERDVWQRRFWEHPVRDEDDFRRHVDYVHYNPVKHGVARRPADWPFSTFHRYARQGAYGSDWATAEPASAAGWEAAGE